MRLLLVIIASATTLAVLLFIIGSLRPKSHVASITVKLAKPDRDVFAVISNVEAQPQWAPDIRSVESKYAAALGKKLGTEAMRCREK